MVRIDVQLKDRVGAKTQSGGPTSEKEKAPFGGNTKQGQHVDEWAWVELNYRPHAYQACALTT
jgi:hypothetical protein